MCSEPTSYSGAAAGSTARAAISGSRIRTNILSTFRMRMNAGKPADRRHGGMALEYVPQGRRSGKGRWGPRWRQKAVVGDRGKRRGLCTDDGRAGDDTDGRTPFQRG